MGTQRKRDRETDEKKEKKYVLHLFDSILKSIIHYR